jgi:hypothetical protein
MPKQLKPLRPTFSLSWLIPVGEIVRKGLKV